MMTVAEHTPLEEAIVTYVGDGNNVCHSLMLASALSGVHLRVAVPPGFEPHQDIVSEAETSALAHGGSIVVGNDPSAAVTGADVVYTDVWASMGQETEAEERKRLFAAFHIDEALFARAADDAIFLHCLPAHRGEEVSHEVLEHLRSRVFDQAENRMHSFKALLLHLTGTG